MLEAQVEISDALAARAYKKAMSHAALSQIAGYYSRNIAILWVVVSIADAIADSAHLITYHFAFLTATLIAAVALQYRKWSKEVDDVKGWSYHAALDEEGVVTTSGTGETQRMQWSDYKQYVEFDTYLQIDHEDGGFSFVPKSPELFDLLEFTKTKIAEK